MLQAPVFETDPGYGGDPVYTPQEPGQPPATPISTAPTPTPTPTPAETTSATPPARVPVPTPARAPTNLPTPVVTGTPRHSAADYAAAARALMPRGRAWPDEPDTVQAQLLLGIGKTFERSDAAACALLAGTLPGRLTAMLPEWEATLGLPDPCIGNSPTIQQRLDQVKGAFVGVGGQSRARFVAFAAALGFGIRITTYAPFRAGRSTVGNPLSSDAWTFVWGVFVLTNAGSLPVDVLMCELEAIKPAETTILLLN